MAETMLKVDNINVYYGNIHAVKDVSFEVNEGEIVTLIGANGAGKSTTLKTISLSNGALHDSGRAAQCRKVPRESGDECRCGRNRF